MKEEHKGYIGVGLYVNGSNDAVKMYCSAFGLELGYHVLNTDGTFFHSELYKDGKEFVSVVESSEPATGKNPIQLGVEFNNKDKLIEALTILKSGGEVNLDLCELPWSPYAAEVADRFGVHWYLSMPQHRPSDDSTPNN